MCITSENLTYKIPENISFDVAAAILMSYLTSDFALHRRAGIKEGDFVLVNAAAGGVGLAAVQLAQLAGARVIAAVRSQEKIELVQKYNAELVIIYREENLKEVIEENIQDVNKDCLLYKSPSPRDATVSRMPSSA